MTQDGQEIEKLFHQLVNLSPEERRSFLEQPEIDRAIRERVLSLLAAHDQESVLDHPIRLGHELEDSALIFSRDLIGREIGHYRVLEVLGSGGMGAVCLAEQTSPIRRPVAIKVIRDGMNSKEMIARFERECQALALLNSPHVATLIEAGTTEDGHPYLVMEYVQGTPITKYCRENQLDFRARLELFLQLCDGLDHAHSRGVIHRDIKPSNVIVTTDGKKPLVKIIDFGISKIVNPRGPRGQSLTVSGATMGTPEYMSPEQAEQQNHEVDERSDVYSAGAVLYELLYRTTLHGDDRSNGVAKPVLVKGQLPPLSKGAPKGLRDVVRRAIEPDRSCRYATIDALASDCKRVLNGQRVQSNQERVRHARWKTISTLAIVLLLATVVLAKRNTVPWRPWIKESPSAPTGTVGRTLRVPVDYSTIQEALDHAAPRDVVVVSPGAYRENLTMPDSVTLESMTGPEETTIDGSLMGSVIDCKGVSRATAIRGFRITHGKSHFGGGIRCWDGASPSIEKNIITENFAQCGGGIAAGVESMPPIRLNKFIANHASREGGGFYAIDGLEDQTLLVSGNEFWGNRTGPETSAGGGVWAGGINITLTHNLFCQNTTILAGGGVWCGFKGKKHIAGNTFRSNSSLQVGGAVYANQGENIIASNKLENNSAPRGPGIAYGTAGVNTIRANVPLGTGGEQLVTNLDR